MSGADMFVEIATEEQARKFIMSMVAVLKDTRAACDVQVMDEPETTVRLQKRAYTNWMIHYGQALGSLTTLMHCRKIGDVAYNELRQQIMNTSIPTLIEVV